MKTVLFGFALFYLILCVFAKTSPSIKETTNITLPEKENTRPRGWRPDIEDPASWYDCIGKQNGTTALDFCGTCGGHNESCTDCKGVLFGKRKKDCHGVCGGTAKFDCAGKCGGAARRDCKGKCNGSARLDRCNICGGNNTCLDCKGVPNGLSKLDKCGVCGGNNSCVDCKGVPNGLAEMDECGVCGGNNECLDCRGVVNGKAKLDRCGDCEGDGTRCIGCDGVPFSNKIVDKCGVCGGNSTTCCGEEGKCSGNGQCDYRFKGCICNLGYTGPFCNLMQDLCQVQQCGIHGRCNPDTGDCVCEEGWSGDSCEYSTCSGHGLYDADVKKCTCFPGYSGKLCDTCAAHPKDAEGSPNTEVTFVCVLKENAFHMDSHSKTLMYDAPLRFMLQAVHTVKLNVVLSSVGFIGKSHKVILPGSEFNGYIYGCDCMPAIPDPTVYKKIDEDSTEMDIMAYEGNFQNSLRDGNGKVISNGSPGKYYTEERTPQPKIRITNPFDLIHVQPSDRFYHFKENLGEAYRNLKSITDADHNGKQQERAPANLAQLQSYVNQISDIFNLRIDAATDEASTVLATVDDVQEDADFNENFNLWFTVGVFSIIIIFLGVAIAILCAIRIVSSRSGIEKIIDTVTGS